ncbi:MAG: carboxypeptidase regulatory-like domain-containing protein [Acidobacteria bacterium]|nr:carboxypeptidase regulatory-like domain-containing protein [Acidobacteriota bacterium]
MQSPKNRPFSCLLAIAALLVAAAAWPQASTSTVSGTVHDQTGAVIPNAQVALVNTATNVRFETRTNETGFYVFPGIIPGPCKLEASSPGMDKYEVALLVEVAQKITVDPILKPGATTTVVTVTDVTPVVNVTDSAISHVINRTQIDQLPRADRNLLNLMVTVPGIEGGGLRAYGLRYGSADFQLDGTPLVSRSRGYLQYRQPGLDSVEEVSVDNNNVSAKYNSPVAVIASTKSGTNQLHGSLFETHVNSRVGGARRRDASNALAPYSNRAQYGGSAGGPVLLPRIYDGRNRTFFFYAYEERQQVSNALASYSVPTADMRAGDFSGLVDSSGRRITIHDPWTTNSTTYARQPWSHGGKLNAIDPTRVSPLWKSLMNLTPQPTLPGVNPLISSNWWGNAATLQNDSTMAARIDHRFSDRDNFYARYSKNAWLNDAPFSGAVPLLQNAANRNAYAAPGQSLALSWVRTFSPTVFNELLATVYRQAFYQSSDPNATVDWAAQLGLPNPLGVKQWPDILTLGLNGTLYRTVYPNADKSTFYQADDNLTKVAGRHQLSIGFHYRRDLVNYLPQQEQSAGLTQPVANWTALWDPTGTAASPRVTPLSGNSLASAYLGQMMYQMKTTHGFFYMRQSQYAAYFQDNFKVSRRLTLNLGLRWQAWPAMHEKYGNISGFDAGRKAVVLTQPLERYYELNPAMAAGVARLRALGVKFNDYRESGLPRDLVFSNWKNFAPRLGFAWRTTSGSRPLVVRAGFSIAHFPIPITGLMEKMRAGIPFVSTPLWSPDSSGYYPDNRPAWSLRNTPVYVAGQNVRNVLDSPGGSAGLTAGSLTSSLIDPHYPEARVHDWNLTLEKEILPRTLARAAWVGNHASNLDVFRNLNPQTPSFIWASNTGATYPTTAGGSRPYDSIYGDILSSGKYGYSNFTGFQLELARRYARGFGYQLYYVVSNSSVLGDVSNQGTTTTTYPSAYYLASEVSGLSQERIERLVNYRRDSTIPRRRLSWNWVADIPAGRGKLVGRGMGRALDAIAGGWQISGYGTWATSWYSLPADMFPTGAKLETYGTKYPIQDCRSGRCLSGFLWYNGYINPAQINSVDAKGNPSGIMGVPANYRPAFQNLIPFPSAPVPGDPNAPYYGTNTVFVPLKDGTVYRGAWGGLGPLRNQYVESRGLWNLSASLFKTFPLGERFRLRVQWDVFNPTNSPQQPQTPGNSQGLLYTYLSGAAPRSMQFTLRLLW